MWGNPLWCRHGTHRLHEQAGIAKHCFRGAQSLDLCNPDLVFASLAEHEIHTSITRDVLDEEMKMKYTKTIEKLGCNFRRANLVTYWEEVNKTCDQIPAEVNLLKSILQANPKSVKKSHSPSYMKKLKSMLDRKGPELYEAYRKNKIPTLLMSCWRPWRRAGGRNGLKRWSHWILLTRAEGLWALSKKLTPMGNEWRLGSSYNKNNMYA